MTTNFVILDCDGGSDDAWALLLLLKAEAEQRLTILGVTVCGCGNTTLHNAARNMLRILKACGRDEIPIFLGAAEALVQPAHTDKGLSFHGSDGFADVLSPDVDIDVEEMVEREHAVAAIHQFCIEHPKQVTIIAVGPLTNLALCYSMYGKQFAQNIKELYIMGGNHQGVGNCTRAAEFNFYSDPEAAHIVLSKSKCPITILPWEPCIQERFSVCLKWRLQVLGTEAAPTCAAIHILNKVETAQYKGPTWNPCDAMLVGVFLYGSQIVRKETNWHATVDLKGCHTRGQMVLDHLQEVEKYPKNVRVIELLDADFFKRVVQWGSGMIDLNLELATAASNGEVNKNTDTASVDVCCNSKNNTN